MCDRSHTYTVEVVGQMSRYCGPDESAAISALLGTADSETGEDGCVTAEHADGTTCPAEGDRIADAAEAALAASDARAEREQAAVNDHSCPRCGARRLNRCRTMDSEHNIMKHPHDQRVRLVKEG